jgi:hypothetical protein
MGSDDNTVRRGWYIDDLAMLKRTKRGPIFNRVSAVYDSGKVLLNGNLIEITDPIDMSSIFIHFSEGLEDSLSLTLINEKFSDTLYGSFSSDTLKYWLSASDIAGRITRFPTNAPDSTIALYLGYDAISEIALPEQLSFSVFPSPFNGNCAIVISGNKYAGTTKLDILDICGRRICAFEFDPLNKNETKKIIWNAKDASGKPTPSGLYFFRLEPCGEIRKGIYIK